MQLDIKERNTRMKLSQVPGVPVVNLSKCA
jgi:hypothetical protein